MELFTVQRYDIEVKQNDPRKEERILERLKRNIEKKKSIKEKQKVLEEEQTRLAAQELDENNAKNESKQDEAMELDEATSFAEDETKDRKSRDVGEDFMILGDNNFQRRLIVDAMLPNWLAYPTVISKNLTEKSTPIENIDYISPELKKCLQTMNIEHLFPVQEAVIPYILNVHTKPSPFRPRDICVSAPTGSGKTLAYALPIVQNLSNRVAREIRALIVLPVNELAVQVLKIFQKLCEASNLKVALLSKFTPFEIEQQQLVEQFDGKYYSKVDILVATSGRLVEHIHSTKGFSLKSLKFLVMDEADRIMEQIQNNWLYHLDSHVKEQSDSILSGKSLLLSYNELDNNGSIPHKLLFSATLSQDPEKLQSLKLFSPKLFTSIVKPFETTGDIDESSDSRKRGEFIGKYTTPSELTEKYCLTEAKIKPLTLYTLLKENNWNRFLCFTNSGESAHRLSYVLQSLLGDDMKIEELSSSLTPSTRNAVLLKFQTGKVDGIMCSDALARGIDFPNVDVVISYDAPRHVKTYIHRIGRTARAGRPGTSVTLLVPTELNEFQAIIKDGGKENVDELKVTDNAEESKAKDYATALQKMQTALKREKQVQLIKQMNEKNKSNNKRSVIGQLQSQVQQNNLTGTISDEHNIPESWKWENLDKINNKKERKGINQKRSKKKTQVNALKLVSE
ncbi:probable ATP-dependent RNA helicase Dbp73D [Contarinia nasturtii]|uniref:probable ATP-dependent RNA helicase Dbp73D n=1 Tax=Contarinia nasturtii TaxID=265458 RepID=UPI0012D479DD|nr:probable ATP-dependent RNA helicase Dbp73D [Contarinia nasturtii]